MPAKAILTILLLVSLGVLVTTVFRALPQLSGPDTSTTRNEILVATGTLPAGTLLGAKDVTWQRITQSEPGQILRPSNPTNNTQAEAEEQTFGEIYGAALRVGVTAGEPIRHAAIVKPDDHDYIRVLLSPAARAIAFPVVAGGASTGLLHPGDHVDVILTQSFRNDTPLTRRSVSEIAVESLRILAVDPADVKSADTTNSFGRTVTLEVTPEQAEKINVATELGKLSLALRSISGRTVTYFPGSTKLAGVRSTWAGDVSPALGDSAPPHQRIPGERAAIAVIHGTKTAAVKAP